jgi:hypothetical protein
VSKVPNYIHASRSTRALGGGQGGGVLLTGRSRRRGWLRPCRKPGNRRRPGSSPRHERFSQAPSNQLVDPSHRGDHALGPRQPRKAASRYAMWAGGSPSVTTMTSG